MISVDCFKCLAWLRKRRSGRLLSTPTWTWTSPSACAAKFQGGVECAQTGPTLYTRRHLSWLSKLGRWQRNRRVVGFTSVSLPVRRVTDQNWWAPPSQSDLVILQQTPAVVLSFWFKSRRHHVEVVVGLEVCVTLVDVLGSVWIFTHTSIQWLCKPPFTRHDECFKLLFYLTSRSYSVLSCTVY